MIRRLQAAAGQFDSRLWILSAGLGVNSFGGALTMPFVAIYLHAEQGMSLTRIGLFYTLLTVVRMVAQMTAGELSDHLGRGPLMILSSLGHGGSFLLLALGMHLGWSLPAIVICFVVNALVGSIFMPVANAAAADILPTVDRLKGYALIRTANNLGWAVGPALGGFLAGLSFALLFSIAALFNLAAGLVFLFFFKAPPNTRIEDRFRLSDLLAVRKDLHLFQHMALAFFLYLVFSQIMSTFPVYAVDYVGITKHQIGLLFTMNGIMVVVLQFPLTRLMSSVKLTSQMALGGLFLGLGFTLGGLWTGFLAFVAVVALLSLGEVAMSPPALSLTSQLAPAGRMGRYMGLYSLFVMAGWSSGPLFGGVVLDLLPGRFALAWVLIASVAWIAGLGYLAVAPGMMDRLNRSDENG